MLLLRNPIGTHSLLTTYDAVVGDPLGAIWIAPRDYHEVTKSTAFDPQLRRGVIGYSRNTAREALVESTVVKHSILE